MKLEQIKNQYGVLRGAMIREMTEGNLISKPQNNTQVYSFMNTSSNFEADSFNKKGINRLQTAETKEDGS